jgi:hypothetical protein
MELSQEKILYALNHYLENISEKIERFEHDIELKREKKYLEEEKMNEWRKMHD